MRAVGPYHQPTGPVSRRMRQTFPYTTPQSLHTNSLPLRTSRALGP